MRNTNLKLLFTYVIALSLALLIIIDYQDQVKDQEEYIQELETNVELLKEENKKLHMKIFDKDVKYCDLMGDYNRLKTSTEK